ncbi:MAG: protein-glutamine glutaminase family protein [Pseudomonadota bacterium]
MTTISSTTQQTLRAVFGDRVPADATQALGMLDASPLRPRDPTALQALRAAVLEGAARSLEELKQSNPTLAATIPPPSSVAHQPMPPAMALRLSELQRIRDATPADGLQRTVSLARARELFDMLAAAPDIPHDFIDEGCHYRAHVENKRLEEAGVFSEKIFIVPDGGDLRMNSEHSPIGFTLAMFHTAPCIAVKLDDGSIERRVLDPSMGDHPLTIDEWSTTMHGLNGKPCSFVVLPRFAMHLMDRDNPPATWRQADLDDALAWNTQYKALQQDMLDSGFYDSLKEMAGAAGG